MAIYLFRHKIKELKDNDVDFYNHLFQPEVCNETNEFLHEREDHCHVPKRITGCLCSGSIPNIDLYRFKEALHDPNT